MGQLGRFLARILLGINLIVALFLLLSAYSSLIDPRIHPIWSCAGYFFPIFLLLNLLFLIFWLFAYRKGAQIMMKTTRNTGPQMFTL